MTGFARRHKTAGRNWARVINISTDGASGYPNEISYWASTHAIESFSRAAAIELGPHGITVNLVSPGPVRTSWIGPDLEARVSREMPLRRVGQPREVADAIVFFASPQACWITGQSLYAGGSKRTHQGTDLIGEFMTYCPSIFCTLAVASRPMIRPTRRKRSRNE
jgi:3-oxoacyl-[acyl-carrier protein] reductase